MPNPLNPLASSLSLKCQKCNERAPILCAPGKVAGLNCVLAIAVPDGWGVVADVRPGELALRVVCPVCRQIQAMAGVQC